MHTSARSAYLHCSRTTSVTSRTAVYGPVRTVVWQGSAGDCRPYADQSRLSVSDQNHSARYRATASEREHRSIASGALNADSKNLSVNSNRLSPTDQGGG